MAIVVFGAAGGLGLSLTKALKQKFNDSTIIAVSRQPINQRVAGVHYTTIEDYTAEPLEQWVTEFNQRGEVLEGVVSTVGMLHDDDTFPEKQLDDLNEANLSKLFSVNAVMPLMILKACKPLLDKKKSRFFIQLSAKVGSIEDNYLGGWYSYRASKAALNMLLKTASIELKRSHKSFVVAAIHPGTTDTDLSKPFQKRVPEDKLYSPELSAERIVKVIQGLTAEDSGGLFHWDGKRLPY